MSYPSGYDHPNFLVRRESHYRTTAGTTTGGHLVLYQRSILKSVRAKVVTAGTATGYIATIQNGTTSIGAITLGTSTAGSLANSGTLDSTIAAMDTLNIAITGDVTGVADFVYEYEVLPDAVGTA